MRNLSIYLVIVLSYGTHFVFTLSQFRSVPTTVKTNENDSVLLPCYLDLDDIPTDLPYHPRIRWFKDNETLADNGSETTLLPPDRFKLWGNGSLSVIRLKHEDTAEYTCEVFRPAPWGPVRQIHAIEVLYPPSIVAEPASGFLQVKLGEDVRISCQVTGTPNPLITWTYNGKEMELLDNRPVLTFNANHRQLSGQYGCIARNGVGNPATALIQVNIIYPPEVITPKDWVHAAPGLRTQLECSVSSDPGAAVTWLKSEIPVPLNSRVITIMDGEKHTLLIRNVRISDFGIYTCRAINDLGQGEINIQLSGVANPGIFKKTEQRIIDTKTSYRLVWEVDSYTPIIEYNLWFRPYTAKLNANRPEWTKLTIPAEHGTGPMHSKAYVITGLKEKTIYEALLVSRNRYGWSKPSSVLRFATDGTEMKEEIVTQIQLSQDMIQLEITGTSMGYSRMNNLYLIVFLVIFVLSKY